MAGGEKDKPWFGKRCTKCNAPINYAYKGVIEGWCGKCTDEVRQAFKDDLRRELAAEGGAGGAPRRSSSDRRSTIFLMFLVGFMAATVGCIGAAAIAPDAWKMLVAPFARFFQHPNGGGGR